MSDFLSTFVALTTSPVLVVGAAEFDRNVKIRLTNAIRVGFASDAIEFVPQFDANFPYLDMRLPAGQELWARSVSGTIDTYFLVTN